MLLTAELFPRMSLCCSVWAEARHCYVETIPTLVASHMGLKRRWWEPDHNSMYQQPLFKEPRRGSDVTSPRKFLAGSQTLISCLQWAALTPVGDTVYDTGKEQEEMPVRDSRGHLSSKSSCTWRRRRRGLACSTAVLLVPGDGLCTSPHFTDENSWARSAAESELFPHHHSGPQAGARHPPRWPSLDHVLRAMLSQQLSLRITFPSLSPFLTSRDTCHACEMSDLPSFLISSTTHKNTARTPRLLHFRTTTHYSHHPSGPLHTIHTILQDHYTLFTLYVRTTTHYSHHPSGPLHTIHIVLQDHYTLFIPSFRTTTHYSHCTSGPLHTIHTILQDHYTLFTLCFRTTTHYSHCTSDPLYTIHTILQDHYTLFTLSFRTTIHYSHCTSGPLHTIHTILQDYYTLFTPSFRITICGLLYHVISISLHG